MTERDTALGSLIIDEQNALFQRLADQMGRVAEQAEDRCVIALTGGSTPKKHYQWLVANGALPKVAQEKAFWTTSDERMVPLNDDESNFGNADRMLLQPLEIPQNRKFPWPVEVDPHSAALVYNRKFNERFGAQRCYDLCVLGMGDDGHTASLFPKSPLLGAGVMDFFACVEVPGKGWRLTITEAGLDACGAITVIVTGANKAERVKAVFNEAVGTYPIQILEQFASRVTWLMDPDAAALIQ
ncbi:MAG: 6-phosphogluconolactonase [Verrucomicrobiota bacterium JB022]|nr:6-phosphogluconolactonase [Verrucomicrobiota bacterium JB022]